MRAYPVVADVRVQRRPLHGLHLTVVLRRAGGGGATWTASAVPVAADGTLLRGEPVSGELPTARRPARRGRGSGA